MIPGCFQPRVPELVCFCGSGLLLLEPVKVLFRCEMPELVALRPEQWRMPSSPKEAFWVRLAC